MNTLNLYASSSITSVSFLIFDLNGSLISTVSASKNVDNVWQSTIPSNLPQGTYSAVGVSSTVPLGIETFYWDGTTIVQNDIHIASSVRTELTTELAHLMSLQNGLTTNQAVQLLELYQLMGLDPLKPLIVSSLTRKIGDGTEISQTIQNINGEVTVTRET